MATAHAASSLPQVVFVMDDLPDAAALAAAAPEGADIVWLDGQGDALAQMAGWLEGRTGIGALHLFSHGKVGAIQLGDRWLDTAAVQERASLLATVGRSLSAEADIFLYGCDVGGGAEGTALLQALAEATGADVAASSDRTGAAALGGDWQLEAAVGEVDAGMALSVSPYDAVLATLPYTETFDENIGAKWTSQTIDLNGIRYTLNVGGIEHQVGAGAVSSLSSNASDGAMVFNYIMSSTVTSVTVSLVDGGMFRFKGLDFAAWAVTQQFPPPSRSRSAGAAVHPTRFRTTARR